MKYTTRITVPAETVGWGDSKRELPEVTAKLVVVIDWDKVVKNLGRKAVRSKGQKAHLGFITVKVVK